MEVKLIINAPGLEYYSIAMIDAAYLPLLDCSCSTSPCQSAGLHVSAARTGLQLRNLIITAPQVTSSSYFLLATCKMNLNLVLGVMMGDGKGPSACSWEREPRDILFLKRKRKRKKKSLCLLPFQVQTANSSWNSTLWCEHGSWESSPHLRIFISLLLAVR